ncbi:MAG: hypothetical protein U0871_09190 [Gemmataceae bacterium]
MNRLAVPLLLAVVGCGPSDDIKTYSVPKDKLAPTAPTGAAPAVATGPDKVRLLGAIIPAAGGSSYFVKMTGTPEALEPHAAAFEEFVKSVDVSSTPPKYTPPAGWKQGPAKAMRLVTFLVGDGDKPLEAYLSEPFAGSVLDNVNRWRNEVGAKPVTEAELPTAAKELPGPAKKYLIDVRGPGGSGGMMPPFMNRK